MTLESMNSNAKDNEIDLFDLFRAVFNHFIMIAILALCAAIIFFAVGKATPDKRNVSVIVQIKSPNANSILSKYGYDYYTSSTFCYDVLSHGNLMQAYNETKTDKASDDTVIYEDLLKFIGYKPVEGPVSYYNFYANETDRPEFYIAVLENAIKNVQKLTTENTLANYELCKKDIQNRLKEERSYEYTDIIDQNNQQTRIKGYEQELLSLEIYKDNVQVPVTFVESRISDRTIGRSSLTYAILGFLLGGIVGVIIAIAIDFSDKRIYSIRQAYRLFAPEDIIASIPLYKDGLKEDAEDMDYIANKLTNKGKNIFITSISDRAGKTTIANALNKRIGNECNIIEGSTITKNPEMLLKAKDADATLILFKAGQDKSTTLISTLRDLITIGTNNIYIILNGIECNDKYLNLYEDKSKYIKFTWIINTWQHFYKKNAF